MFIFPRSKVARNHLPKQPTNNTSFYQFKPMKSASKHTRNISDLINQNKTKTKSKLTLGRNHAIRLQFHLRFWLDGFRLGLRLWLRFRLWLGYLFYNNVNFLNLDLLFNFNRNLLNVDLLFGDFWLVLPPLGGRTSGPSPSLRPRPVTVFFADRGGIILGGSTTKALNLGEFCVNQKKI